MNATDSPPVSIPPESALAVIGAGAVGLEAAALAALESLDVVVFEKESVGHHIRQWGHVTLFSSFCLNHSEWGERLVRESGSAPHLPGASEYLTGLEYVERYLEPLSRVPQLRGRVFERTPVVAVGKEGLLKKDGGGDRLRLNHPFRLLLNTERGERIHRARAVIDASGVYSNPQFLGSGNIPAPGELEARRKAAAHLHYGVPDIGGRLRPQFAGRSTLLVGGGHSAATALEALHTLAADSPATRVLWVNCSPRPAPYERFENDPLPDRDRLSCLANEFAHSPPPWLEYVGASWVDAIEDWPGGDSQNFRVLIRSRQGTRSVEPHEIVASVGFRPDESLYRQLQVHQCWATLGPMKLAASLLGASSDCLAQDAHGIDLLKNPEPGFFVLGNKSYGTNSTFLIRQGIRQVRTVMEHLGDAILQPEAVAGKGGR